MASGQQKKGEVESTIKTGDRADRHIVDGQRSDLAVLNKPEYVFKAVVVEEHSLQDRPVRALQNLRNSS